MKLFIWHLYDDDLSIKFSTLAATHAEAFGRVDAYVKTTYGTLHTATVPYQVGDWLYPAKSEHWEYAEEAKGWPSDFESHEYPLPAEGEVLSAVVRPEMLQG